MDKYLRFIGQEEEKISLLENRSKEISKANKKYAEKQEKLGRQEKSLLEQREKHKKRKFYLENRESCKRSFLKKAIAFGIKCSAAFISFIVVISFLVENLGNIPILQTILSFLGVGAVLSMVEYKNVSREYKHLLEDYHGDIDEDLKANEEQLDGIAKEKINIRDAICANERLLLEIEGVLQALNEEVLSYRTTRNNLIEKLIGELDTYIGEVELTEIDIHKVIEKKIH